MEKERLSKAEKRVLDHIKKFGSITSWEAIKEYGNTRLSSTIHHLRKKGYTILTSDEASVNRYGDKVRFGRYYMAN